MDHLAMLDVTIVFELTLASITYRLPFNGI
jgi:hypothetical protein